MNGDLVVGLPLLLGGALAGLRWLQRASLMATPLSRIADAPGGRLVAVKGKIVAGEELLMAPFADRPAVWVHVGLSMNSGRSASVLIDETRSRPFFVDDGSGQLARILPEGATVESGPVVQSGWSSDPSRLSALSDLVGFEKTVRIPATDYLGLANRFDYEESLLAPGDELLAIGPSRREPVAPSHDDPSAPRAPQLALSGEGGVARSLTLILGKKSAAQLIASLRWRIVASAFAAAAGLFLLTRALAFR